MKYAFTKYFKTVSLQHKSINRHDTYTLDEPIVTPLNLAYVHNDTSFDRLDLVVHIQLFVILYK